MHAMKKRNFHNAGAAAAAGMANEESWASSFAAAGCWVLPHIYREDPNVHRQHCANVFAD